MTTSVPDRGPLPAPGPAGVLGYGLLTRPGIRQIMACAGYSLSPGLPRRSDWIAVWGHRPSSRRGTWVARQTARHVLRVEDAFLAGLHPGNTRLPPYGLMIDRMGVHYDPSRPSEVETLLATASLADPDLLHRAETARARLIALGLGKYLHHDLTATAPPDGHVLVIDQVQGDASVAASRASRATFLTMLDQARQRFSGHPIAVRAHPAGRGHLSPADLRPGEIWDTGQGAPLASLSRARAVLTVSSGFGLDAIWAGHRPILFGAPVYAGWGLTEDSMPLPRRERTLSRTQLFAALMIRAPVWYDPFRHTRTDLETILDIAEAETRAAQEDRDGYVAHGMSLWKRRHIAASFGGNVRFPMTRSAMTRQAQTRPVLAWASTLSSPPAARIIRVEDGFLRSRGLGARLTPPLSLMRDDTGGIYYDPSQPSRLEQLILSSTALPPAAHQRARNLIARITETAATKYGQGGSRPPLPSGQRVLVIGQVDTDASLQCGATGAVRTNADLLSAARSARPEAKVLYKPHPDVEAGLRPGHIPATEADLTLKDVDPGWLLHQVDEVWTLTSLMGFEALLRGVPVVCLGAPFYAGWGLTEDHGPISSRRTGQTGVTLSGLAHAALIDAPRYIDPETHRICPVEMIVDHLAISQVDPRPWLLRVAAKVQGGWVTLKSQRPPHQIR